MALREILVHFGFDFDQSKADAADRSIHKVKGHAEEATGGVMGLVEAFKVMAGLEIFKLAKEFTLGLAEQLDSLGDLSEATGLSTKELQVWQFGAAKSGESAEVFTMALRKLSAGIAGGKDEAGTQAVEFGKLGIKTKDAAGKVRSLAEVLPEIADHFKNTEDGAGKAALAQQLFGRSGTKLIPLLNKGAQGVAELTKEFDELGGGFSEEAIRRGGEMKEAIARVGVAFDGFKSQLAIGILPKVEVLLGYLTKGVASLTEFAHETTLVESAIGSVATALVVTLGGALAPYLFGAMKFAAVYLAVDDLIGFLNGQDSEIGAILDSWFGDGSADAARSWVLDAEDSLAGFVTNFRAVLPLMELDFTIFVDRLIARWTGGILSIENSWNSLIEKTGLRDEFKIDTKDRAAKFQAQKEQIGGLNFMRQEAETKVQKFARDTTPTAGAIQPTLTPGGGPTGAAATATAPIITPTHQTYFNVVQGQQVTNITVPPGTSAKVTQDIAREVGKASRESQRAALQALESRGAQ